MAAGGESARARFARRLRELAGRAGLSQADLLRELQLRGVEVADQARVSDWWLGKVLPHREEVVRALDSILAKASARKDLSYQADELYGIYLTARKEPRALRPAKEEPGALLPAKEAAPVPVLPAAKPPPTSGVRQGRRWRSPLLIGAIVALTAVLATTGTIIVITRNNLSSVIAGMAPTPGGEGYYLVTTSGQVLGFGDAPSFGGIQRNPIRNPIVGITVLPDGSGYWMVDTSGKVFGFGNAQTVDDMDGKPLNAPMVGIVAQPDSGYWLAAADGGVFAFPTPGSRFYGSAGSNPPAKPVVALATKPPGDGYWLVTKGGQVLSFGKAAHLGDAHDSQLDDPIVGMAALAEGGGYWLTTSAGKVFAFGDARSLGGMEGRQLHSEIVGIAASPIGQGYWLVTKNGQVFSFGDVQNHGSLKRGLS
jgi:hypothetical protein